MKSRTPIPKAIKEQVINRNGGKFCEKCGKKDGLHFHHIIAVRHGGTDDLHNLAMLCDDCHREWHSINTEQKCWIPHHLWVDWTPIHAMLSAFKAMGLLRPNIKTTEFVSSVTFATKLRCRAHCSASELFVCALDVAESPLFAKYPDLSLDFVLRGNNK